MKVALFLISFFLLAGCKNEKDKDKNEAREETENNDRTVETNKEPAFYIAFREDENGTVYLTDSDEDIDRLIVDLRPLGVEVALLEREYWRDERCRKMSSRRCAAGNCLVGNCQLTEVGGWNVCRCQ